MDANIRLGPWKYLQMSDFGKKMLEKFGWSEGKGLGKNNNGISKSINPATQNDSKGIGSTSHAFVNWWDDLYSSALSKIQIPKESASGIDTSLSDSNHKDKRLKKDKHLKEKKRLERKSKADRAKNKINKTKK